MRRTISVWPVAILLAGLLIAFLWSGSKVSSGISQVEQQYDQSRMKLTQLQNEQAGLKETLEMAGTEAFIENQARTLYGYMKPDEIRFVITNPEALYGTENVPAE